MTNEKILTLYYKTINKLKQTETLTCEEMFTTHSKIKQITDSIIYFENQFYKVEKIYGAKKFSLEYPLKNIKIKVVDLDFYKNSERKILRDFYFNDIVPKLIKLGLNN